MLKGKGGERKSAEEKGEHRECNPSEAVRKETEAKSQYAWNKEGICRAVRHCLTTQL